MSRAHGLVNISDKAKFAWFIRAFTVVYLVMQLLVFHLKLENIPYQLGWFWGCCLFFYVLLNKAFKFGGIHGGGTYRGGWYVFFVVGSFMWMLGVNIYCQWVHRVPYSEIPDFMFESAVEAVGLWVLSLGGSIWLKCRNGVKDGEDNCNDKTEEAKEVQN